MTWTSGEILLVVGGVVIGALLAIALIVGIGLGMILLTHKLVDKTAKRLSEKESREKEKRR